MPEQNIFQYEKLSYASLPEEANEAVINSLTSFGFAQDAIVKDYSFYSTRHHITVNALAFAHPSHRDLDDYASITVLHPTNEQSLKKLIPLLAGSSAPFHLIYHKNFFSFWTSRIEIGTKKRRTVKVLPVPIYEGIAINRLGGVLHKYADDLKPQRIIEVKQGHGAFKNFSYVDPLQLSLWAEDVRSKPLVQHFEHAINSLRNDVQDLSDEEVTIIATQLLGLLILADKGVFGEHIRIERPPLWQLIKIAYNKFPHYFSIQNLLQTHQRAIERAYTILENIQYAGFEANMLGDLYAAAYPQEERKHLGNYDTSLYITRRILENIPIEYLPPDKRIIADFTCGWGSFLIAGYERLARLSDSRNISLQRCLYGNDYDIFFTQLARLGLLCTTLQDDWRIDNEDVLQGQKVKSLRPDIIIGNPPFEGNRKISASDKITTRGEANKRERTEKANQFLEQAIQQLQPGGYLALIMPRSFAVSEAGQSTRQKLLEICDILELWDLPRQLFKDVTVRTMVIFAQKKFTTDQGKPSETCVRTRSLQRISIERFESMGTFTASTLTTNQAKWNTTTWHIEGKAIHHIFDYTTILSQSTWDTIKQHCVELRDYAEPFRGIARGTRRKQRDIPSKLVRYLPNAEHVMPSSFKVDYTQAIKALYPDDFERPRLDQEKFFQGAKVLLQYLQEPNWGYHIKLAIEHRGYYISEHFYIIAPELTPMRSLLTSYEMTNELLAAILGWDVSNAWILEHMKSPGIPSHPLETLPIPTELSENDRTDLIKAVQILEIEAPDGPDESLAVFDAQHTIDRILKAAYHLDEETFTRLRQVKEWRNKPHVTLDPGPDLSSTNWFTSGIVQNVQADKGTITLWIDGFDDLQTVHIVPAMPGWMLRPGAAFLTKFPIEFARQEEIDPDNINWAYFHPQPYMYMNNEELLTGIARHFSK